MKIKSLERVNSIFFDYTIKFDNNIKLTKILYYSIFYIVFIDYDGKIDVLSYENFIDYKKNNCKIIGYIYNEQFKGA